MIRQPTPVARLYAWHRAALAGRRPPVHEGDPHCGWYKTRLVKGGPFVPASISITREVDANGELTCDEKLVCEVNGERRDPARAWLSICKNPISRAEYVELQALQQRHPEMAATHAPIRLRAGQIRP
jgi:hypothetical protein